MDEDASTTADEENLTSKVTPSTDESVKKKSDQNATDSTSIPSSTLPATHKSDP